MIIKHNAQKLNDFNSTIINQDLAQYKGLTRTYTAFESINLTDDIKMSILKKLSTSNHLNITDFETFWAWAKKKHGMALATDLAKHIHPNDATECNYLINKMRGNKNKDLWNHLKARFYKKWCSIVTEMQCVYALTEYAEKSLQDWSLIASPRLDAIGVDFAILIKGAVNQVYPFQIKKDSYNVYAQNKDNARDNFYQVDVKKKPLLVLNEELEKLHINSEVKQATVLKYGLARNKQLPYNYLAEHENGFVYYNGAVLAEEILANVINKDLVSETA